MEAAEYQNRVNDARPILYAVIDLLRAVEMMVRDDDGANEQAVKRIVEAIAKSERASELLR